MLVPVKCINASRHTCTPLGMDGPVGKGRAGGQARGLALGRPAIVPSPKIIFPEIAKESKRTAIR